MSITIISALDRNNLIGSNNSLPWHIKEDLKFFKSLTLHNNIVMGRKTFEGIGKPLLYRTNIVLTRDTNYSADGCIVLNSVHDVLNYAALSSHETFIIGGTEIYQQFIPLINNMILTHIDAVFNGDSYFPTYNKSEWEEVNHIDIPIGESTPYPLRFAWYNRKINQ